MVNSRPFAPELGNASVGKWTISLTYSPLSIIESGFFILQKGRVEMIRPELHLISNGRMPLPEFARVASRIHPFVTGFHLREKARTAHEIWEGLSVLLAVGVPSEKIYVNDRVDIAVSAKVKGVQLGAQSLLPNVVKQAFPALRVGRSVHSVEEARAMEENGADFLIYGHIFPSHSKTGLPARGISALREVGQGTTIPVIAIGGVVPSNVRQILEAGAAGIAVMSGILEAVDPLEKTKQYYDQLMGEFK
jgi:thiazole tautomerase (transcriptional regulator TenI)